MAVHDVFIKSAEEALETLRMAAEAASLGMWDLNPQTGELHWSDLSRAMFGVAGSGSLTIQDFWDRIHPDELDHVQSVVQAALDPNGTGAYDIEYRVCRPDGEERLLKATGKAFFEEVDGERVVAHFIGTLLDRTDQKLTQAALLQAEQIATTGRLAASISHENNNPLEIISNLLYLLRDEIPGEIGKEYLKQAEAELARVSEIATNTLRFYKDPKGTATVNILLLVQSVVALFRGKTDVHRLEVECRCDRESFVLTSAGELRQVLVNLIGNAIDAMADGGKLKIRCHASDLKTSAREPRVRLTVADTGIGMSPETLSRAFDPFFTTKGSAGTGLGLWLCREILAKHGFNLRVKSKLAKGTVFSISMPATEVGSRF